MSERNIHRGDGGETQLGSGQRVRKDDPRIECVGSVDELSSFLGLARAWVEAQTQVAGTVLDRYGVAIPEAHPFPQAPQ